MHKVVITGPECSGKTTLAQELASHYQTVWIPEFARSYVEKLDRKYDYSDVEKIALRQIEVYKKIEKQSKNPIVFFDTYLIITKVWFKLVFGKCPEYVKKELEHCDASLFLLCKPDLEWKADRVRENPNRRQQLFDLYEQELQNYGFTYQTIKGKGKERIELAVKFTQSLL